MSDEGIEIRPIQTTSSGGRRRKKEVLDTYSDDEVIYQTGQKSKPKRTRKKSRKDPDSALDPLLVRQLKSKEDKKWKLDRNLFVVKHDLTGFNRHVTKFYLRQNRLVEHFRELDGIDNETRADASDTTEHWSIRGLVYASFSFNLVLLVLKIIATALTGSLALVASTLDSFLDLLSGSILFLTHRAMKKHNIYMFPAGKSRLEPLGIIVFASVMFTATFTILIESTKSLLNGDRIEELSFYVFLILGFTLLCKLVLFILCFWALRYHKSPSVEALKQDHRNDLVTNSFGTLFICLSYFYLWYLDALGAMIIAGYIMYTWARTGWEHVQILTGKSATPEFLSRLTYLCWNHDAKVLAIDTVRAFHLSFGYLVEVDIVLPETMLLKEAHDIGESLQWKLEALDDVERAFVHLDYEFDHKPEHIGNHRPEWTSVEKSEKA